MKNLDYFCGQGIVYLARRDPSGSIGEFQSLLNTPKLEIFFNGAGSRNGEIELTFEGFGDSVLDLLFGGKLYEASTNDFFSVGKNDFKSKYPNLRAVATDISMNIYTDFCLVFEGINTVTSSIELNKLIRVELLQVHFSTCEKVSLIDEDLQSFRIKGKFFEDRSSTALVSWLGGGTARSWGRAFYFETKENKA